MTQQQATIRNMGAIREHHAVTIPATPFTDGRPDPRPETAPPRGIVSHRTAVTPAQVVEIIRRELVQWRAAQ